VQTDRSARTSHAASAARRCVLGAVRNYPAPELSGKGSQVQRLSARHASFCTRASEGAITKNNISGFMSEYPTHGRRDATAEARSVPQDGAAGAPQPRHMMPCACHCAACRAAGHGDGACVVLCAGLHALFDGKADVVDVLLRHYYGACGWGTVHIDAKIYCVQYGPAGDVIAAGSSDGRIHFICAQTGEKILCPLRAHSDWVKAVAWSPCGQWLASGGDDKMVYVYDTKTFDVKWPLRGHSARVNCVDFSPDGLTIASGSGSQFENDNSVRVWDAKTGKQLWQLTGHQRQVSSVHFSPDGKRIVSGSWDSTVRVWDPSTGEQLCQLTGHQKHVSSVHFSPDGKRLVSGSWDKTVMVWDPSTGEQLCRLRVDSMVFCLSYAPSGDMLAVGDCDGNIHFFNAQGEKLQSPVRGHSAVVRSVCFSSDGKQLASGSEDTTARNWDPATRASLS